MKVKHYPIDEWVPKEDRGAVNVETRMLVVDRRSSLAEVRFATNAVFLNKDSEWDCHVMCTAGSGYVAVGGEKSRLSTGDAVLWPKGIEASLTTDDDAMTVLLLEHLHQVGHGHSR